MKWKTIVDNAEKVKESVEKKGKIIIDGKYSEYQLLYVFAKAVKNPNHDYEVKTVYKPSNPIGNTLNKTLTVDDYKNLAYRIVKFIDETQTAPNYATYKGYAISPDLSLYCFSKIIVYYNEHSNTLPLTCKFNSTNIKYSTSKLVKTTVTANTSTSSNKKYGHSTKSGCDNMGQNNGYYCGCHSLQEVFRNLTGIVVPQSTIAAWAGTTTSGTGHDGLNTAVATFNKRYNKNLKVTWKNFSDLGWSGIKKIVDSNNQDCVIHNLYRNQWGHYETVNDVSSNVNVQNSLGNYCGSCYCGYIEYRTQSEFRSYISGISQKSVMVITRS